MNIVKKADPHLRLKSFSVTCYLKKEPEKK